MQNDEVPDFHGTPEKYFMETMVFEHSSPDRRKMVAPR
jgi:hypothetical protein